MTEDEQRFPSTSTDLTELIQEALARPLPLRRRLSDWWRRTMRRWR